MQTEGVFLITHGCDPDHIIADRLCLTLFTQCWRRLGRPPQLSEFIIFISLPPLLQHGSALSGEEQPKQEASDVALRPFLRAVRV